MQIYYTGRWGMVLVQVASRGQNQDQKRKLKALSPQPYPMRSTNEMPRSTGKLRRTESTSHVQETSNEQQIQPAWIIRTARATLPRTHLFLFKTLKILYGQTRGGKWVVELTVSLHSLPSLVGAKSVTRAAAFFSFTNLGILDRRAHV